MRSLTSTLVIALAFAATAPAAPFNIGPHHFTLPDGFTIEVAAPASLAPRPIEADFDEQGRLYVTDSAGSNDKVAKQLADKPHRILRLEDTDGDGVFDKSVVFADKMMFPEGCLWHDGSLYVSAPPSIWKLTDTNNDGVADVRVEWFKGRSLGGCANDLHGPYLGPDGWIYWCKGGFERQTNILGNGKTFVSRASHIYRARADGTGLEPIMTGGMDNPVGLTWSREGELFLCGTFFQHPGGGKRDGIIHVLYGGVYGKENDVLEGHPRTGELLPMMTHLGPAAPCGMTRFESGTFGAEYRDNLFVCNFNLHKITRHILKPTGSTFTTVDSDFLVSDNTDFHPTDVMEDADGSLLIVDTGGWYKLCCPTSQLQKPDVLGAIYRVRRKDASKVNDPRGLKIDWNKLSTEELVLLLGKENSAMRTRAIRQLSLKGSGAVPALGGVMKSSAPEARRNAVWALTRIETSQAREIARLGIADRDESVRQAAVHSASLLRDTGAVSMLKRLLREPGSADRRAAAAALGRLGDPSAVDALFSVFADYGPQDRAHEHSLEFAVMELRDPDRVRSFSRSDNVFVSSAAMIALDQMAGGSLKPEEVTSMLALESPEHRRAGSWIISHHPDWGGALAGYLKARMEDLSDSGQAEFQQQLAQFAQSPPIQSLLADTVGNSSKPKSVRSLALHAMGASRVKEMPREWAKVLASTLNENGELTPAVVATVRALPSPERIGGEPSELVTALAVVAAGAGQHPPELRLDAAAALLVSIQPEPELFELIRTNLSPDQPVARRRAAVDAASKMRFSDDQMVALTDAVRLCGPLEMSRVLSHFSRCTNETVGLKLLDALKESKSLASLRPEQVRPNLTNFPATVRAKADELLASLNTDAVKQKAQLEELATKLALNSETADIRRGQALFNGQKAACSTCHAIGYLGGNLGPDLTRIGQVRTERDLLESIVFPSASFVRSFEPMVVVTKSGDEHSGIVRRDTLDEIVLATGPITEERIARADIVEMRPGTVSVMPQGLDQQLTRGELADLLAFLKATKW